MISNNRQRLIRKRALLLADMIHVLIVTPAEHDIIEPTAGTVDAVFGAVDGVFAVGIVFEGSGIDDAFVKSTADREGVADYVPLATGVVEEEEFT